jgi:hypothetical protein
MQKNVSSRIVLALEFDLWQSKFEYQKLYDRCVREMYIDLQNCIKWKKKNFISINYLYRYFLSSQFSFFFSSIEIWRESFFSSMFRSMTREKKCWIKILKHLHHFFFLSVRFVLTMQERKTNTRWLLNLCSTTTIDIFFCFDVLLWVHFCLPMLDGSEDWRVAQHDHSKMKKKVLEIINQLGFTSSKFGCS